MISASSADRCIPRHAYGNLVDPLARDHIQRLAVGAAEGEVGDHVFRDGDPTQQLAALEDHINAGGNVGGLAAGAGEVMPPATQRLPVASRRTPSPPRPLPKSKTSRCAPRARRLEMSKAQILRLPPGRVWLSIKVEGLGVGSDRQAVGPLDLGLGDDAGDLAVEVDPVDRLGVHFEGRAVFAVIGVGEPDPAQGSTQTSLGLL